GGHDLAPQGDLHRRRTRPCRYRALVSENGAPRIHRRFRADGERRRRSRPDVFRELRLGAARNYAGYCSPEVDQLVNQQSMEANPQKRKEIVWQIERKLAEAAVRPVLFYPVGATCRQPWVKGLTIMTNSIYNEWRMEDVWLDK